MNKTTSLGFTQESKRKTKKPSPRTATPTTYKRSKAPVLYHPTPTPTRTRTKSMSRTLNATFAPHQRRNSTTRKFSLQLERPEDLLERGKRLVARQEFKEAVDCFKQVLLIDRNNLDALYSRAVSYIHLQEHKAAIPDLLAVAKARPLYDKQVYVALSMCFAAVSDVTAAVRHISKCMQKFPKFTQAYIIRGQLYNQQELWDKAIGDFRKAI